MQRCPPDKLWCDASGHNTTAPPTIANIPTSGVVSGTRPPRFLTFPRVPKAPLPAHGCNRFQTVSSGAKSLFLPIWSFSFPVRRITCRRCGFPTGSCFIQGASPFYPEFSTVADFFSLKPPLLFVRARPTVAKQFPFLCHRLARSLM